MKQMVYFKILNDDCQLWKYYAANWIKKANSAKDSNFTLFIVRGKLYFSINKNSTLDPFSTFRYFLHKKLY